MKKVLAMLLVLCMAMSVTAFAAQPIENVPGAYDKMSDHPDCEHVWIVDHANHYVCASCNSYGGCVPPAEEVVPTYYMHYRLVISYYVNDGIDFLQEYTFDDDPDAEFVAFVHTEEGARVVRQLKDGSLEISRVITEAETKDAFSVAIVQNAIQEAITTKQPYEIKMDLNVTWESYEKPNSPEYA